MIEKVTCHSEADRAELESKGYVVVSIAYLGESGNPTYTLERDSEWSEKFKKE